MKLETHHFQVQNADLKMPHIMRLSTQTYRNIQKCTKLNFVEHQDKNNKQYDIRFMAKELCYQILAWPDERKMLKIDRLSLFFYIFLHHSNVLDGYSAIF